MRMTDVARGVEPLKNHPIHHMYDDDTVAALYSILYVLLLRFALMYTADMILI